MRRFQESRWCKLLAVLVLLLAGFLAGISGTRAATGAHCRLALSEDWRNAYPVNLLLNDRISEMVNGVKLALRLEELEPQLPSQGDPSAALASDIEYCRRELEALQERLQPENTWFRFRLIDGGSQEVLADNLDGQWLPDVVGRVRSYAFFPGDGSYFRVYDYEDWLSSSSGAAAGEDGQTALFVECGVSAELTPDIQDEFYRAWTTYLQMSRQLDHDLTVFLLLLSAVALALASILWTAGHKQGAEGIVLTWQDKIFFDLYAAAAIALGIFLAAVLFTLGESLWYHSLYQNAAQSGNTQSYETLLLSGIGLTAALAAGTLALLLRTFAVRLKAGRLAQTTLLCRVVTWTVRTVRNFVRFLPFTWKILLGFFTYFLLNQALFTQGRYNGGYQFLWAGLNIAVFLFLSWWAMSYHRLRQGTKTIARGDMEHQIDTRRMPYDLRLQAEDLNNISAGLSAAVEQRIQSERFKAELITNVSHDLKTPLTSIINYVDLLKKQDIQDLKALEYLEVLDRKSQRLKKLTEDLVEASKASTGVLSVNREQLGFGQLVGQALGEYEERFRQAELTAVTDLPSQELYILADGRHLWRVIDNLLGNCCKYAMPGTRVYLSVFLREDSTACFSIKNISKNALNIPPEQLMERFVRGDASRTSEGSGLGLSIARSLTELQGGSFSLDIDADLFKALVVFPLAPPPPEGERTGGGDDPLD